MYSMTGDVDCISIQINGDRIIENDEEFTVEFIAADSRDQFSNTPSTEITIEDNDGKQYLYFTI